ncbi:MAG: 16S rRNA (uracil(1498)-N(3))-methyltransferase [Chlorobi bacterium]|nr:16S rRNA (uracil(1498)-N(3))-methyltransferase [Chlorobiota bacterium]
MECLYVPDFDSHSTLVTIDGDAFKHLRALRCNSGEHILLSNGKGIRARGVVSSISRDAAHIAIKEIQCRPDELPCHVTVAVGILSSDDRIEWLVEKCTELGVHRIIPLQLDRCQRHQLRRPDRLEKKAIAALEQSQRSTLPEISQPITLETLLRSTRGTVIACDPRGSVPNRVAHECTIVVGPEGGFSEHEETLLAQYSCVRWSLGPHRLRTETAALSATAIAIMLSGVAAEGAY